MVECTPIGHTVGRWSERFTVRLTPERDALIRRAAEVERTDLTTFRVDSSAQVTLVGLHIFDSCIFARTRKRRLRPSRHRLTGDTLAIVDTVTVRELRNRGGEVLRRVEHGERIVITRDGTPVAELRPLPRSSAGPAELIGRRKNLPQVDPGALRRDIDNLIDPSL
ncbi:type II toxin-antitoxin system prevent-host-death family antitoxin [Mycolicibacterium litorale]|uniref:Type II toxin-antitoxin system prevent-host-death family antitoxin n=1 Tax=Candidatus Mycolicibacterium alkanivorans TaxID=2954114 RepID=A0ABS9YX25_9MYCO|nr:type II toxin-antitoxin system prevent-host-death family antitoxin [Candidatus Mycolicibacterium alkanivorans]